MEEYLRKLYNQYCETQGKVYIKPNIDEFTEWIAINKKLLQNYKDYQMNIGYITSKTIAEIGKGKYDSISDKEIEIISPYAETLKKQNRRLVIMEGIPLIINKTEVQEPIQEILLTHNPYDKEIFNWKDVHNNGLYDINIGVFGHVYDKDYIKKLKLIKKLSTGMNDDFIIDYETNKDEYYCSINSKRKQKIKILIR